MAKEFLSFIDMFSHPFQFNVGKRKLMKGTYVGAILSISICAFILFCFIIQAQMYFNNQIDPKFRSQTFVANQSVEVQLQNHLIVFQYFQGYQNLDAIQKQQNKTYIVTFTQYTNRYDECNLDIIDCINPQLNGYKCIDYSKAPVNKIFLSKENNTSTRIRISAYKCQDVDRRKTFVPNNCASPEEIDSFINNKAEYLFVKLSVSQFNITSKQIEKQYRQQAVLMSTQQVVFSEFKAYQQITSVKEGVFLQKESNFQHPISYTMQSETFSTQNVKLGTNLKYFAEFFQVYKKQLSTPQFNIQHFLKSWLCAIVLLVYYCVQVFQVEDCHKS
ncbi:hypothetical protein ABPG72_002481 [Tetrahymena utriculariae]